MIRPADYVVTWYCREDHLASVINNKECHCTCMSHPALLGICLLVLCVFGLSSHILCSRLAKSGRSWVEGSAAVRRLLGTGPERLLLQVSTLSAPLWRGRDGPRASTLVVQDGDNNALDLKHIHKVFREHCFFFLQETPNSFSFFGFRPSPPTLRKAASHGDLGT